VKNKAFHRTPHLSIGCSRRSWTAIATSILLSVASACVGMENEEDEVSSQSQAVLSDCIILRSYAWHQCSENVPNQTLVLSPGQSRTFFAGGGLHGLGSIKVICHTNGDGDWDEDDETCRRDPGF
jgi:hypothetical protein